LAADFWIGSGIVWGFQFLDRQRHSTWLLLLESAAAKPADF
jgi:hypothetical protein